VSDAIIVCEHVSVAYGRDEVLHDVSLEIGRGSFLPVVGPNGAGKTTLLRVILGLARPRRGRVHNPFHRCPPGYVPQHKSIDPLFPVSVRQIVAMGLYPHLGWWRRLSAANRDSVRKALAQFRLAEHADKTFSELSGGMKQKALIARALVSGAEVLVMDEPSSELDEQSEKEILAHLSRLSREEGKTVILAHHGLDHVAELAPVLCLVNHGRVSLARTGEALASGHGPQSGSRTRKEGAE
jgi:ABC-type Mn2+/Zn2+ transport system ATPase subunit